MVWLLQFYTIGGAARYQYKGLKLETGKFKTFVSEKIEKLTKGEERNSR